MHDLDRSRFETSQAVDTAERREFLDVLDELLGEGEVELAGGWGPPSTGLGGQATRAIASGERNENRLTDLAFYERHPELGGRRLRSDEQTLASEWLRIRDSVVRPALQAVAPGPAPTAKGQPRSDTWIKAQWRDYECKESLMVSILVLDTDKLCVPEQNVLNELNCWAERDNRVKTPERARLVATVLGIGDPARPQGVRPDPVMPGLLNGLLDAINAYCRCGDNVSQADVDGMARTAAAVRARLSSSMTGLSALRVRELAVQFTTAKQILADLAPYVHASCRPNSDSTASTLNEWTSVSALLGSRTPDGVDLVEAAATARAWETVFSWLADADCVDEPDLCLAAARLRPMRTSHCGCAAC